MKAKIFFLFTSMLICSCSTKTSTNKPVDDNNWSTSNRIDHLKNIQDSTTWDNEMLESDKQIIELGNYGPFASGAFPVPEYDILGKGSFKGLGNKSGEFEVQNKKLLMNSFFIKENELNKTRIQGKPDEVFFQIIVLTDTVDDINYNLNRSQIISRNHPDYLGQGFIATKNNRIDYLAFLTAENEAFAIVNTRLFNLNYGKTILIAPQKDKTLRSLQIQTPQVSFDSITDLTHKLLKDPKVVDFFVSDSGI